MELRQIRSFLSIAETLHFGRTAKLIHISQPALSLQIRALEEEVGVRLFERNRRKTTLTAAGEAFRDDAVAALSHLDQAIRKARLAANGKLGLLRIGFISGVGAQIVPSIARQFKDLNPEVEFSLLAIPTAHQLQMLQTGSLDIGFLRLPIGEQSALEVLTVHREPFVLVVPSSHKLAKRDSVSLSSLAIHWVFEDSSLERQALPDDFTWQSHIYRNDLHGCSPSSSASKARAVSARGPALSVVGEPTFLWGSEFVNHAHAALACVVSLRLRNSRMVSAISR